MSNVGSNDVDKLALIFKALSNPQRLRIYLRLAACCAPGGACAAGADGIRRCVGELGAGLGLAASTLSHHLKELRQCGLMHVERRGRRIECWVNEAGLRLVASMLDDAARAAADEARAATSPGGSE